MLNLELIKFSLCLDEERAILESLKNFYSMGRAIFCLNPPQTNIAGVGSEGIGLFLT